MKLWMQHASHRNLNPDLSSRGPTISEKLLSRVSSRKRSSRAGGGEQTAQTCAIACLRQPVCCGSGVHVSWQIMKQTIARMILIIPCLLAVPAYSSATDCAPIKQRLKVSQVCGHVVDVSGAAIPGAKVELLDGSFKLLRQVVADDDGNFLVTNVSNGQYQLVVIASGYGSSQGQPLTVTKRNHEISCRKPLKVKLNVGSISCGAVSK